MSRNERGGVVLTVALAIAVLSTITIPPLVQYASTASKGVSVNRKVLQDEVALDAAAEHLLWRMAFDDGFVASLTVQDPCSTYNVDVNGTAIPVTACRIQPDGYTPPSPPAPDYNVQIEKTVVPLTSTSYAYTISVINTGAQPVEIFSFVDEPPPPLQYVAGSTGGVGSFDPQQDLYGERRVFRWDWPVVVAEDDDDGVYTAGSPVFTEDGADFITDGVTTEMSLVVFGEAIVSRNNGQVTQGSPVLTSSGANFISNGVTPGMAAELNLDPEWRTTIVAVVSETEVELTDPVPTTANGVRFSIHPAELKGIISVDSQTQLTLDSNFATSSTDAVWAVLIPPPVVQPSETATLVFNAAGTLDQGTHYNRVAADILGLGCRISGPVAPIIIGDGLAQNVPLLHAVKTANPDKAVAFKDEVITYSVTLYNNKPGIPFTMGTLFDQLPRFFSYEPGSASGFIAGDPVITEAFEQQLLRWDLDQLAIQPNETMTFSFRAIANAEAGVYENVTWVTTDHPFVPCAGTGMTAPVIIYSRFSITASSAWGSLHAVIRLTEDGFEIEAKEYD